MIKKIKIVNFQSHKNTEINLIDFNVIHGISDSGKSAVRKALQCVLFRTPFYLRKGEEIGYVEVEFDDCTIKREYKRTKITKCPECKEKLTNEQTCDVCGAFISNKPSSDVYYVNGKEFQKFGTELPPMITSKTKFKEVVFGDSSFNLQVLTQHEDMFFIGKSYNGKMRNNLISALVPDSDVVEKNIKAMNVEKNETTTSTRYKQQELENCLSKMDLVETDIADCKEKYAQINLLEEEVGEIENKNKILNELFKIHQNHLGIKNTKPKIEKLSEALVKTNMFVTKIDSLDKRRTTLSKLSKEISLCDVSDIDKPEPFDAEIKNSCDSIKEIKKMLNSINSLERSLAEVDVSDLTIPTLPNLSVSLQSISEIGKKIETLYDIFETIECSKKDMDKYENEIEDIKKLRSDSLELFKKSCSDLYCPLRKDIYSDECLVEMGLVD